MPYGYIFSFGILASILAMALIVLLAKNKFNMGRHKTNSPGLIGSSAIVVSPSDGNGDNGRVMILHQEWAAQDVSGKPLEKNDKVLVKGISGVTLMVEKTGLVGQDNLRDARTNGIQE